MNDTTITIVGNAVDDPRMRLTKQGVAVASFRIASTSRRYDKAIGAWIDNEKIFATVTCWRALAENVAESIHRGQPVVVTGRFFSREYTKDDQTRISYELDAYAVGHDLSRGTTSYTKTNRPQLTSNVELDAAGIPTDRTSERIDELDGPDGLDEPDFANEPELVGAA